MVLLSPYTWLKEYTPKEEWIGGKMKDGENLFTRVSLEESLSAYFDPYYLPHDGTGYEDPVHGTSLISEKGYICLNIPFVI